jgi:hypothetical protein
MLCLNKASYGKGDLRNGTVWSDFWRLTPPAGCNPGEELRIMSAERL